MSRGWIGALVGGVIALVIVVVVYLVAYRGDGLHGGYNCVKEDGLPGAAAGKLYYKYETDAVYEPGTVKFMGYCDIEGHLIYE